VLLLLALSGLLQALCNAMIFLDFFPLFSPLEQYVAVFIGTQN